MNKIPFSENELVDVTEEKKEAKPSSFVIDPSVRLGYFQSLGGVKKVQMQGQNFIKDSEDRVGKRNSLDGYEMFVIPAKSIAVLEKLYETSRDQNGNIDYVRNQNGEKVPAIESETYFMPMNMARDFMENSNKRAMLRSPFVEKAYHTSDWVISAGQKMDRIMLEMALAKGDRDEISL